MSASAQNAPYYFIPAPSKWPAVGSVAMLLFIAGMSMIVNNVAGSAYVLAASMAILVYMLFGWFGAVVGESEGGLYSRRVDVSFRWSMSWFIFSEVMFFAAFFGALFYARTFAMTDLGALDSKMFLWPDFMAVWPNVGPAGVVEPFVRMGGAGIPTINTALLLTSGVTLTIAHHALIANQRGKTVLFMILTVLLGIVFLGFQAYEYAHAYSELNLKLSSGIYGSTFFMLTGFHGFHVTLGAIMLIVITARLIRGHFRPDQHFGFEAVAWYWHFVDVVWLGLYVVVYWL
ncbi:MAG TPA: cytochrome c oxidase subunit 3 [Burkholderiaceae bacterium]|nr:cytochrome c oxidase subunit 3 [Burkholderiaceae bacterium]